MRERREIPLFHPLVIAFVMSAARGEWNVSRKHEYYVSSTSNHTYNSSLQFCEENGGTLALIQSDFTQNLVEKTVAERNKNDTPSAFFIGLRNRGNKTFIWDDWEPLVLTNWGVNEPNYMENQQITPELCVVAGNPETYHEKLKWKVVDCKSAAGFLCQRPIANPWSGWGAWSNCNCSLTQSQSRHCFAGKDEAASCDGIISETRTRKCAPVIECTLESTSTIPNEIFSTAFTIPIEGWISPTLIVMAIVIAFLGLLLLVITGVFLSKKLCQSATPPPSVECVVQEQSSPRNNDFKEQDRNEDFNDVMFEDNSNPVYENTRVNEGPDENDEDLAYQEYVLPNPVTIDRRMT